MSRTGPFAAAALVALQLPFGLHPPVWVERLLWNPRERTAAGSDAYQAGRYDDAVAEMERARRVAGEPAPPAVDFNAATAHLAAGEARAAVPLLESAAERTAAAGKGGDDGGGSDGLATAARYNLGNARLAAGDLPGAVEAYKSALHLAPDHADAKYNLELALRRLAERRRPRLKPPEESPAGTGAGERERSPQGGGSDPSEEHDADRDRRDAGDQPAPAPPEARPDAPSSKPPPPRRQALPGFQDQPDMTAAQAAALLEAVENLEREQRRATAAQRARRKAAASKDW